MIADLQDFSNRYIEISFIHSGLENVSLGKSLQNLVRLILVVGICEAELPNDSITERKEAHDIFGLVVLSFDQRTIHICKFNLREVNGADICF